MLTAIKFLVLWRYLSFAGSVLFSLTSIALSQPVTNPIGPAISTSGLSAGIANVIQPTGGTARLNLLSHAGDGSGRLFVNDITGKLWVMEAEHRHPLVFADLSTIPGFISGRQRGFISFAFHPGFDVNGIFYTVSSHTTDSGKPDFSGPVGRDLQGNLLAAQSHHSVLHAWTLADPAASSWNPGNGDTRREILRIAQPYSDHNMGQIGFNPTVDADDPDYGLLYIAIGDGGNHFPVAEIDPAGNGQGMEGLGGILRIDPLGTNGVNGQYGIPADNPWNVSDTTHAQKLYRANGLRNPHRFSWDQATGNMLIADIGQDGIEEINMITPADTGVRINFGWSLREGLWKTDPGLYPSRPEDPYDVRQSQAALAQRLYEVQPGDDEADFGMGNLPTAPVAMYDRDEHPDRSLAVTGGFVYRGRAVPELTGKYIFGDFPSGRIFFVDATLLVNDNNPVTTGIYELMLLDEAQNKVNMKEVTQSRRPDLRFGIDENGEIYITTKADGFVRKLVNAAP